MLNQGENKRRENIRRHDKKKEIPKLIIRIANGKGKIIRNSVKVRKGKQRNHESVKNNAITTESQLLAKAMGASTASIIDRVKQHKRRRTSASDESSSSSPTTSLPLVEKTMDQLKKNSYKGPIPIRTPNLRNTLIDSVQFNYYLQHPTLNSSDLPSKKTKLLEHSPSINDKGSSARLSPFDIYELEVASYEEVLTSEPPRTSCEDLPSEFVGVNDVAAKVHASSNFKINSTILPKEEERAILNTEKNNWINSDISCKRANDSGAIMQDHNYLSTINEKKDIDVLPELKDLDLCAVEEFFSSSKELLVAKKKTDDHISEIVDLAFQIEKLSSFQRISSKVNGLPNKEHGAAVPSKFQHSSEARQYIEKIVAEYKNTTNSNVKKLINCSSSSTSNALNNRNRSVVSRQETHATKEKEKKKAMDGRCIVFVGNIPNHYSESQLRKRFQKFGCIKDIQIKSKVSDLNNSNGHSLGSEIIRNFGFITFSCNQEASAAIEGGNIGHTLKFQLNFGARRQFVGEEYRDLDGIVAKNENHVYKCNSSSTVLYQKKQGEDYDLILNSYLKDRDIKPQPFRMKCKA